MERLRRNSIFAVCLLFALAWAGCDPDDPIGAEVTIRDTRPGSGALAEGSKIVTVHYTGMLASNGDVFDTTRNDDREPLSFHLDSGLVEDDTQGRRVIEGFTRGVPGMRVGGTRLVTVPPQLAWGRRGAGCTDPEDPTNCTIPPNATLIFDIELIDVREPEE